jgi:excinuclease ABC subunit B
MKKAIDETNRRRTIQLAYNAEHGITPETIRKEIKSGLAEELRARKRAQEAVHFTETEYDRTEMIAQLEADMFEAAEKLEFEKAARLRDQIQELKDMPEMDGENARRRPATDGRVKRRNHK